MLLDKLYIHSFTTDAAMIGLRLFLLVILFGFAHCGHVISACRPRYGMRGGSIVYYPGNSSIILVVPNAGAVYSDKMPIRRSGCWQDNRCNWSANCLNKSNEQCPIRKMNEKLTRELAIFTSNAIHRLTGDRPHVIMNRYHIRNVDVSVPKAPGTANDAIAGRIWDQFHCYIDYVENQSNTSLIIELHESMNWDKTMEFGYLLDQTNWHFDDANRVNTSLHVATTYNTLLDVIVGHQSLGGQMQNSGYNSVPSHHNVCFPPEKNKYKSGSYITRVHGSSAETSVDAVYVEVPSSFIRYGRIQQFSRDFAAAIVQFWQKFYD